MRLVVSGGDDVRLLDSNARLTGAPVADLRLPLHEEYDNTVPHELTDL